MGSFPKVALTSNHKKLKGLHGTQRMPSSYPDTITQCSATLTTLCQLYHQREEYEINSDNAADDEDYRYGYCYCLHLKILLMAMTITMAIVLVMVVMMICWSSKTLS